MNCCVTGSRPNPSYLSYYPSTSACLGELTETMRESEESNPEALKLRHKIRMETHIKSRTLMSGEGSTTYQVNEYIANMMTTSTDPSTSKEPQKESEDVDMRSI
mmetsp:Transcript_35898/g.143500  ORF Transcript_35898/g.143500 Transcript_35898/m.143500 type:complete len:104 (-) Transcript_35898:197-508(-)